MSFEILNPPTDLSVGIFPEVSASVKVPKTFLSQVIDHKPRPCKHRKIFYANDLEFDELRLLGRFQEYLLMNSLCLPTWVFEYDLLALKCLKACHGSFKKAYERISIILKHYNTINSLKRCEVIDILVLYI
jgi:hypothetical protein